MSRAASYPVDIGVGGGGSLEIKRPERETDRPHLLLVVSSGRTPATFHTHLPRARQYSFNSSVGFTINSNPCVTMSGRTAERLAGMCNIMAL